MHKITEIPDDIIAMRIADREDWGRTCHICPAHDEGRRRRGEVEVECELLRAINSGRISKVLGKLNEVTAGFNGDKPDCGPLKSARTLRRSVAQIRRQAKVGQK